MFTPSEYELESLKIASPFAYQYYTSQQQKTHLQSTPDMLSKVFERPLKDAFNTSDINHLVKEATKHCQDESDLSLSLRALRYPLMVRFIWQDVLGLIALETLIQSLSAFADAVISICLDFVYERMVVRYGEPYSYGKPPKKDELAVIAMGKLGAKELNLSSDIDLIFVHIGAGETNGRKSIDSQKFMTTLGQKIIKLIDDKTELGFVFRVDMRLRPWGEGAPLVIGLPALANYFDRHGRTWERFAWLKARVINPISSSFFEAIESLRKNFVFRYYVDYSAFSALREMRTLISNQVAQRQDLDNVKLGVGGIRDIEFIAQSFALIYGGKYPILMQNTACLSALDTLGALEILDNPTVHALKEAYVFLRRLEHAIQARDDTQTQKLPKGEALLAIALTLGFKDSQALLKTLSQHRQKVSYPFDELVAKREYPNKQYATINHDEELGTLNAQLSEDNLAKLDAFWQSKLLKTLSEEAKNRLNKAYPILIHALLKSEVNVALPRLLTLLEATVKRSIYLVMLSENPRATMDLMPMLVSSPWIASELASYPVLLDTFLQKHYRHLPNKEELGHILAQSLLSVADFDDEAFLMSIRLFKKAQVLAVATSDILAHHPIMKVSDSLTFISEVVLEACLKRAFFELSQKHGFPLDSDGKRLSLDDCGFAIIGYGKLGGIEMGYASDLDVVFLHRVDEQALTDGKNPISGMKFATRLVQKLITFLTTQTRDGRAYELDMRLRPSGNAGVMVISITGFAHYQADKAWVWEHQALVRARSICGDARVRQAFERTRKTILCLPRDSAHLRSEVLSMRQKMKKELSSHHSDQFHLKQDAGGLVDIEFMAQYAVLNHAHQYEEMATWSDNIRIFETAEALGVWDSATCQALQESYLKIRKATHIQALLEQSNLVTADDWTAVRQPVIAIWQRLFADEA